MGKQKQLIRERFRQSVSQRDGYKCRICGDDKQVLDAHHITDRNQIVNGGYVKENGIALCPDCHMKAEAFHTTGIAVDGYSPEDLYRIINSSLEKATKAAKNI